MSMAGPFGNDPDDRTTSEADAYGHVGRLGPGDLAPDEERLLAALERDARGLPDIPVLDTIPEVRVHPGGGSTPPPDDGLTPLFAAPDLGD